MSKEIATDSLYWTAALMLALMVHSTIVWFIFQNHEVPLIGGATGHGDQGLEVGLGMRGSYAVLQQRMKANDNEPVKEPEATPVAHPFEPEPIEEPEPLDIKKEVTPPPVKPVIPGPPLVEAPSPMVKKNIPETETVPDIEKADYQVDEQNSEIIEPAEEIDIAPKILPQETETSDEPKYLKQPVASMYSSEDVTSSQQAIQATGIAEREETGGNPAARQSYLSKVLARIARFKRYPREARHDGVTGVVTVTFTVLINGSVSTQQISSSSGDARLDKAALDMLLRASPLAPIPRELGSDHLKLTLPIEFSLNKKRSLF